MYNSVNPGCKAHPQSEPLRGGRGGRVTTVRRMGVAIVAIVAATSLAAQPAAAELHDQTGTIKAAKRVSFDDLDITRPSDLSALKQRVRKAARDVCAPDKRSQDARFVRYSKCFKKTYAQGVRQIERAVAYAREKGRHAENYRQGTPPAASVGRK